MKTIIYTSFDCLIKGENIEEVLQENQHLSFENVPARLSVYPINKKGMPSFEIDFQKQHNLFYRIVEKDEKMLVFLVDGIYAQNFLVQTISCENNTCQIEIGKNEVIFACNKNKKILKMPEDILSSKCGHFHHIAYAKLEANEVDYLVAYNTKNYKTKILKSEKVEITENGFILSGTADGYNDGQEEYIVTKEGLKIKSKKFSTLSHPQIKETLCYRFLSSVKKTDFSSAFSMLSLSLQKKVSEASLKDYFGNISYLFPLDEKTCFAISNNKSTMYTFSISNNKIEEIFDNH